jgi:sulfofructosephosphate aldolase
VLSQGVEPDDFPHAVEAACRGGASGCLAGRALWTAALPADDPTELVREWSVPRLRELNRIVDEYGRPWRERA